MAKVDSVLVLMTHLEVRREWMSSIERTSENNCFAGRQRLARLVWKDREPHVSPTYMFASSSGSNQACLF